MPIEYIILISVAVLLVALFIIVSCTQFSKLSKLKATVKESFSTLEVFLQKRLEIIVKLLDNCSEEALKDKELSNLLNSVSQLKQNLQNQRRYKLEANLDNAVLTAQDSLQKYNSAKNQQLILNLNTVQSDIISTKNYYNNNVEAYNKKLNKFPSNLVARMFGFKKEYYIK